MVSCMGYRGRASAEYLVSSFKTCKCKICESNIDKDELKLGIKETNFKKQEYTKWYHIDCFKKHNNIDMNIVEDFYNKHSKIENQIKPVITKKSNTTKKFQMKIHLKFLKISS